MVNASGDTRSIRRTVRIAASFVRPANVDAYAAKDEISSDTVAEDAVPLTFEDVAQSLGYGGRVVGAALHSSQDATTNCAVDLLLFDAEPTMTGDGAEYDMPPADAPHYLGTISFLAANFGEFKDTKGAYVAAPGRGIGFSTGAANAIYGVLVARGAYTPASEEGLQVTLDIEQD